jgi:hypothetical protein
MDVSCDLKDTGEYDTSCEVLFQFVELCIGSQCSRRVRRKSVLSTSLIFITYTCCDPSSLSVPISRCLPVAIHCGYLLRSSSGSSDTFLQMIANPTTTDCFSARESRNANEVKSSKHEQSRYVG